MATALYRLTSKEVIKVSLQDQQFVDRDTTYWGVLTDPLRPDGDLVTDPDGNFRVLGYAKIFETPNTVRNATQPEIDTFANELWDLFTKEVSKYQPLRGGRYNAGAYSMGIHVMEGMLTRPTADGRKAMYPLSNSLSPVNNVEKNGITATLNSIAKLNYELATNGVAVNVRFHPFNFESDENVEKFYYLLKGYFEKGGMQIQPTVVSTETLRDAQKHPENYIDLIVKVGGYNATFVDLGVPIQNDIIDRLENNL